MECKAELTHLLMTTHQEIKGAPQKTISSSASRLLNHCHRVGKQPSAYTVRKWVNVDRESSRNKQAWLCCCYL